jgi:hypothetical protein
MTVPAPVVPVSCRGGGCKCAEGRRGMRTGGGADRRGMNTPPTERRRVNPAGEEGRRRLDHETREKGERRERRHGYSSPSSAIRSSSG